MYSMRKFGQELNDLLDKSNDIVKISRWAEYIFAHHCRELSEELEEIVNAISAMEHGPEFEYTEQELRFLAELLIREQRDALNIVLKRRSNE